MKGVLIATELDGNDLSRHSRSTIAAGRSLAVGMSWWLRPIGLGVDSEDFARSLELCGTNTGLVANHDRLRAQEPEASADAVAQLAHGANAGAVIAPSTPKSNRVLAETAARLNAPFFANCSIVAVDDHGWLVSREGDLRPSHYPMPEGPVLLSLTETAYVQGCGSPKVQEFTPDLLPPRESPIAEPAEVAGTLQDDRASEHDAGGGSQAGRLTTLLSAVAVFMIALELTVIAVALPNIAARFVDASASSLGWIFTAYNVGVAALLLAAGWAAERFGRKRLFLLGLLVFAAGSVASGAAPTIAWLIAGRVVQSIGGAMLLPSSLALILHAVPPSGHKAAIGTWGATAGLAAAIGPTLGALLVEYAGWRSIFLINVPIALGALVIGGRKLTETSEKTTRPLDLLSVVTGAAATGLGVYAISRLGDHGLDDPAALATGAVGALAAVAFARRTVRHPDALFPARVARLRSYAVGQIGTGLFAVAFSAWLALVPTFLVAVWGYSILEAGFALSPAPLVMALSARPAGLLSERWGLRRVITLGLLPSVAAVAYWLALIGADASYLTGFLPGAILFGIGLGVALPMLTAAALRDISGEDAAIAAAGNTTCRQVAMAIGIASAVAIVGSDFTSVAAYKTAWAMSGVLATATLLLVTRWYPQIGTRSTSP